MLPYCRVKVLARVLHACIIQGNSIIDLYLRQQTSRDLNPYLQYQKLHFIDTNVEYMCELSRKLTITILDVN